MDSTVLVETLRAAVPQWVDQLSRLPVARREVVRQEWAARGAQLVASHGDLLMFPKQAGKRHRKACPGPDTCSCLVGTAEVFNAMARGLAAGAFAPGGITFAGVHWCVNHARCEAAEQAAREAVTTCG